MSILSLYLDWEAVHNSRSNQRDNVRIGNIGLGHVEIPLDRD
jgi:hypothetical protein